MYKPLWFGLFYPFIGKCMAWLTCSSFHCFVKQVCKEFFHTSFAVNCCRLVLPYRTETRARHSRAVRVKGCSQPKGTSTCTSSITPGSTSSGATDAGRVFKGGTDLKITFMTESCSHVVIARRFSRRWNRSMITWWSTTLSSLLLFQWMGVRTKCVAVRGWGQGMTPCLGWTWKMFQKIFWWQTYTLRNETSLTRLNMSGCGDFDLLLHRSPAHCMELVSQLCSISEVHADTEGCSCSSKMSKNDGETNTNHKMHNRFLLSFERYTKEWNFFPDNQLLWSFRTLFSVGGVTIDHIQRRKFSDRIVFHKYWQVKSKSDTSRQVWRKLCSFVTVHINPVEMRRNDFVCEISLAHASSTDKSSPFAACYLQGCSGVDCFVEVHKTFCNLACSRTNSHEQTTQFSATLVLHRACFVFGIVLSLSICSRKMAVLEKHKLETDSSATRVKRASPLEAAWTGIFSDTPDISSFGVTNVKRALQDAIISKTMFTTESCWLVVIARRLSGRWNHLTITCSSTRSKRSNMQEHEIENIAQIVYPRLFVFVFACGLTSFLRQHFFCRTTFNHWPNKINMHNFLLGRRFVMTPSSWTVALSLSEIFVREVRQRL